MCFPVENTFIQSCFVIHLKRRPEGERLSSLRAVIQGSDIDAAAAAAAAHVSHSPLNSTHKLTHIHKCVYVCNKLFTRRGLSTSFRSSNLQNPWDLFLSFLQSFLLQLGYCWTHTDNWSVCL